MNHTQSIPKRPIANIGRAGASLFVASLDSATLPDMGDRSLDQETHEYIRPRRRAVGDVQNVVRRSQLPFPEPRLPDVGLPAPSSFRAVEFGSADRELRQFEENAGLEFFRSLERARSNRATEPGKPSVALNAAVSQGVATARIAPPANEAVRRACAGQSFVIAPPARDSFLAVQPDVDLGRANAVVRRASQAAPQRAADAPRIGSLEANIAKISERKPARIAVLAIGVSEGAIGKVGRLADVLRERHSRNVEVLAAEQLNGLRMASELVGNNAGDVCLVACHAASPRKTLPFLSQFDAVILMVEIGETPVDEAADWADTIRRNELPIIGVWAA